MMSVVPDGKNTGEIEPLTDQNIIFYKKKQKPPHKPSKKNPNGDYARK